MIVTTRELFKHAYGKYAIGAYNINNLEQTMGLFEGNVRSKAPFIVQLSKGARNYTHKKMLEAMMKTADEIFPDAIFAVHLDHGDEATCMDCIDSGVYSSVMIDASAFPYEKNIEITKRVVDAAHAKGLVVEAELGQLKGVEEDVKAAEHVYTKPEEVVDFVSKTGCDSLACAIGTSHGAFKFSGDQKLRYDILEEIQKKLPGFPLVMHGSSSVPPGEVARINAAGGEIKGAKGVDATQFLGAAKRGVTKINIDTDGRLVWCRVHREFFRDQPAKFDLRDPGKVFMKEYADFIYEKNCLLGSAYRADEVRASLA
ncbi:MAG: ketose-bisphosphate aldolase [Kiritimatiellae bacterium]|nr:ketose-bisphosphate aldolase [Kiritimatiellia bacterium]MBR4613663.1 ketose-bisphosphate aldolase [Kiritimatiellia bacterium]